MNPNTVTKALAASQWPKRPVWYLLGWSKGTVVQLGHYSRRRDIRRPLKMLGNTPGDWQLFEIVRVFE